MINFSNLISVSSTSSMVYLNSGPRSGFFTWNPSNLSTQVTNDPGQGIYIPHVADATGSNGAWVREYSGPLNLAWWGLTDLGFALYAPDAVTPLYDSPRALSSLVWSKGIVTGTISSYTWPVSGVVKLDAKISGTTPSAYNGQLLITPVGTNQFTYEVVNDTSSTTFTPTNSVQQTIVLSTGTSTVFVPGAAIAVVDQNIPATNWISGTVVSYNFATKTLVIGVNAIGSSPYSNWFWNVCVSPGVVTTLGAVTLPLYVSAAAVANSVTNSIALANFGIYARYLASKGNYSLHFVAPPAITYTFNDTACNGCFYNLAKKWIFELKGSTWTNLNTNTLWPWLGWTYTMQGGDGNTTSSLIATTVPGTQSGTFVTPTDANKWSVGEVVMAGGLDIQHYGYPINLQYFEYWTITSLNPTTGAFTIAEFIRNELRSDWPDGKFVLYYTIPAGAARIWRLSTTGHYIGFGDGTTQTFPHPVDWDVDVSIIGPAVITSAPYSVAYYGYRDYQLVSGRRTYTYKITGPGWAQSVCEQVVHDFQVDTSQPETDKLIGSLTHNNLKSDYIHTHQSANDRVVYRNCQVLELNVFAKNFEVDNCDIMWLGWGGLTYGMSTNISIKNSRIYNVGTQQPTVMDGTSSGTGPLQIDGTVWTYANGVFQQPISAGYTSVWCVPGQWMMFAAANGTYSGDLGAMLVLKTYQDNTNVYIVTDSQYSTLPSWIDPNNTVYKYSVNNVTFENCTGCDFARNGSEAYTLGIPYYNYRRYFLTGVGGGGPYWFEYGKLISVTVNVHRPGQTPTGNSYGLQLGWPSADASTFVGDAYPSLEVIIDTNVVGKRTITIGSFIGKTPFDTINLAGAPLPNQSLGLPPNKINCGEFSWYYLVTGIPPVVDVQWQFDNGMVRRLVPTQFNQSGSRLTGIVGPLP